jgi:hypothetical protein
MVEKCRKKMRDDETTLTYFQIHRLCGHETMAFALIMAKNESHTCVSFLYKFFKKNGFI